MQAVRLISWADLGTIFVVMSLVYGGLRLLASRLERGLYLQQADGIVRAVLRVTLLAFAPIALLIFLALFVAIWPVVHGLVVALVIFIAFPYLRDFLAGRILRFDRAVQEGRELGNGQGRGTIAGFGVTGLYLQQEEGRRRIGYSDLVRGGYTVTTDSQRGGYFRLQVILPADTNAQAGLRSLRNALVDNPYVREGFRVEVHPDATPEHTAVEVNVGVNSSEHVSYLTEQLRERGYAVTVLAR